jgi:hypothetical protein
MSAVGPWPPGKGNGRRLATSRGAALHALSNSI